MKFRNGITLLACAFYNIAIIASAIYTSKQFCKLQDSVDELNIRTRENAIDIAYMKSKQNSCSVSTSAKHRIAKTKKTDSPESNNFENGENLAGQSS